MTGVDRRRLRYLLEVIDVRAGDEVGELLSVSIHHGVVPRSDITDDEPRADQLNHYKRVSPGDIVINRMRAFQGAVGVSDYEGIVSPEYLVVRPNDAAIARYLHYLFRSHWFVGEMVSRLRGIGSADQGNVRTPRINVGDLGDIKIPLPSKAVQREIVAFLDAETERLDSLIEKKGRLIEVLDARSESLIAARLDPLAGDSGEEPLKSVAELRVSNVDKKSHDGQVSVMLCNYTDVYYNRKIERGVQFMRATASEEQIERLTLQRGDVLITKDSETADDIGVASLVIDDLPGVVLGYHLALLRPVRIAGSFLYWVLRSRRSRDAFSLAATGVTRVGLRQDAIGRVPVPRASPDKQYALSRELEEHVSYSEKASRLLTLQIKALAEQRKALITATVTGELDVARPITTEAL